MTTNADAITALAKSKAALQGQCDTADGDTLNKLETAIHNISSEIGELETSALSSAPYVPATDAFKQATADAKGFLATLSSLKAAFATAVSVAGALDSVINLITKLGL